MPKQTEPGSQNPLRPAIATLTAQALFSLPVDATPPVDWTQTNSRIPLALQTKLMDDTTPGRISVGSNFLQLRKGQYRLEFQAVLDNTAAAVKGCRIAFTNGTGATVYRESPVMSVPASSPGTQLSFEAIIHLPIDALVFVRAVQTTATAGLRIASGNPVLTVTRIGNVNEA